MPLWRYVSNRFLTLFSNIFTGAKLSEFHTGYRAFSRGILQRLPLEANSDDFVFDNQMLAQVLWFGCTIAEISCPTRYSTETSSISFRRSVRYGFGCLSTAFSYRLAHMKWISSNIFPPQPKPNREQRSGVARIRLHVSIARKAEPASLSLKRPPRRAQHRRHSRNERTQPE